MGVPLFWEAGIPGVIKDPGCLAKGGFASAPVRGSSEPPGELPGRGIIGI